MPGAVVPTRTASVCSANDGRSLLAVRSAQCPVGHSEVMGLVGVNVFDALWCSSEGMHPPCTHADVRVALRFLAASGLRFFRFFASLYGPAHAHWLHNPPRFWAAFDRLLDDVEALGLQAVPSIGAESWHEVANRWTNASVNASARGRSPRPETVNDLVTNASSLARALALRYTDELVRRYRRRRSILFWELGNELNLKVNMVNQCGHGAYGTVGPSRCFNTSALVDYTRELVDTIRRSDAVRPVSSGFGVTRPNAWHQERCRGMHSGPCSGGGEGAVDTIDQWQQMVQWQNEAVDIASAHVYPGLRGCWFGRGRIGCRRQGNVSVVEAAAAAAAAVGKPLYVGEYGGPAPNFTGPGVDAQAFPEAVLRWQVGRMRPLSSPAVLSSIWGWMCPSKRATMRCIYPPPASRSNASSASAAWRPGEEGSARMVELLQWADRRQRVAAAQRGGGGPFDAFQWASTLVASTGKALFG